MADFAQRYTAAFGMAAEIEALAESGDKVTCRDAKYCVSTGDTYQDFLEETTMNERVCSACGGATKLVVLIEDHGPAGGEKPSAIAPGQAHRSLGVVYNEHYPTDATACTVCGHIDL